MNNDFWENKGMPTIVEVADRLNEARAQIAAKERYLDDTLSDLNDSEKENQVLARNLRLVRRDFADYTSRAKIAFDMLQTVLEELAYQTPYEDGANAKVELVKGMVSRVRRHLYELGVNDNGVLERIDDIPF